MGNFIMKKIFDNKVLPEPESKKVESSVYDAEISKTDGRKKKRNRSRNRNRSRSRSKTFKRL